MNNVAYLIGHLNMGGAENLVVRLAKKVKENGINPIIITIKGNGPLEEQLKNNNIEVISLNLNKKFSIFGIYKLYKIIKEKKVEVIHTHSFNGHFYGTLVAKLLGVRSIHTEHSLISDEIWYQSFINKLIGRFNYKIVAVSELVYESIIQNKIYNKNKTCIINNGVDTAYFNSCISNEEKKELKKQIGINEKDFVLTTVAGFRVEKNHNAFLDIFREIVNDNINIKWLLVGDGYLRKEILQKIKDLNLENNVICLGLREDIKEILNITDIFVLPSKYEGLSLALLEAMACNNTAVVTNVGGNGQLIKDGVNGFLVELNDLGCYKEKIKKLYEDRDMLEEFKHKSFEIVNNSYSFEETVSQYINYYYN